MWVREWGREDLCGGWTSYRGSTACSSIPLTFVELVTFEYLSVPAPVSVQSKCSHDSFRLPPATYGLVSSESLGKMASIGSGVPRSTKNSGLIHVSNVYRKLKTNSYSKGFIFESKVER